MTQRAQFDTTISQQMLFARLAGFFGFLAVVLVGTGLYGTLAYRVSMRTAEIGVRMAVGARRGQVVWMILKDSLALTVTGVVIGIPLAMLVGRALYLVALRRQAPRRRHIYVRRRRSRRRRSHRQRHPCPPRRQHRPHASPARRIASAPQEPLSLRRIVSAGKAISCDRDLLAPALLRAKPPQLKLQHNPSASFPRASAACNAGGERGIRTPDTGFSPYNGLANRRLQPLGHLSASWRHYTGTRTPLAQPACRTPHRPARVQKSFLAARVETPKFTPQIRLQLRPAKTRSPPRQSRR